MKFQFAELHARQQYRLLNHGDLYTRVRCEDVNNKRQISETRVQGEEAFIAWCKKYHEQGNLFMGRNPVTHTGAVERINSFTLDIDPERGPRTAANLEALSKAIRVGQAILRAYPGGRLCSSGNGALIIYQITPAITDDLDGWEAKFKSFERTVRERFATNEVKIDATADNARLIKVMGSTSVKGEQALWRQAKFLNGGSVSGESSVSLSAKVGMVHAVRHSNASQRLVSVSNTKSPFKPSDRLATAESCLKRLTPKRADDYSDWLKVGIILSEFGQVGFELWDEWSKQSNKYDRDVLVAKWATFSPVESISVGTLKFWADTDNPGVLSGVDSSDGVEIWTPESGLAEYRGRGAGGPPELPTGFAWIDEATYGIVRGQIFTVQARTNVGKTAFAITVAQNLCARGKSVLYMSTESSYMEIWHRYFAVATGLNAFKIQNKALDAREQNTLDTFLEVFPGHKLSIYDGSSPSIDVVRKALAKAVPDVIVFDYFQHIEAQDTMEMEKFVRQMKDIARENNIGLLMCAQLHGARPDPKTGLIPEPTIQDLKKCRALNDESRTILIVNWATDKYKESNGPVVVTANIAKNKGPMPKGLLKLDKNIPRFEEIQSDGVIQVPQMQEVFSR